MLRQNWSTRATTTNTNEPRTMPVGSELLIAFPLGMVGWWMIVHAVRWITG